MDRRRVAGALLALAVCIAGSDAAPTASNQTSLDLYDGASEGCYYNFQHYGEGDRIMTNEPCLNCTCHNRMLMCYLRVCPFTKPIGQDCTVEKRADQCCPIVTCPDVPVDLLTSTSTTSPAEYGATGLGKLDKYGCSINGKYFPEGSKVPPTPNKPCEHCYCIRNMTTCVMQECTLHVDGCTPIYHKDVCCPVRYSCDHPEDEIPLLDDMTTTVRPTPGFLLTTTTSSLVTQMSQDCVHDDQIVPDGALIKTEKACEHCYCMKGDIVCVVQECGTPMENEGKNCTSIAPKVGQCCPDTYICEGDELNTETPSAITTEALILDELTTVSPPRRVAVEGSGYRNEPDETYTESPYVETESEGSGYEQSTEPIIDISDASTPDKLSPEPGTEIVQDSEISVTTTVRTPTLEEVETTELDNGMNTVPSGTFEEEDSSKPTITDKIISEHETKTTIPASTGDIDETMEGILTTDAPFVTDITHKLEEGSSITESAFRKEDEYSKTTESDLNGDKKPTEMTTEQPQQSTTELESIITSATLLPSIEDNAMTMGVTVSDDSVQTTIHDETPHKEIITESPFDFTTHTEENKPALEITTQSADKSETDAFFSPTEKTDIPETTSIDNKENEVEDVPRIPGEGDCLLNEITYRNNSDVPSTSKCHTGCRCVSSIIKCNPIICSPPPEYMDNCQPTYDTPDSCCPTYECHTGETMPPQSHSHMSGTESPVPSPSIECEGDECSLSSDSPILASTEKPKDEECGSDCSQPPPQILSSEERIDECIGDKCLPPTAVCSGENCQATPIEQCEDGKCVVEPEIIPVKDTPLCQNENECTVQQTQVPTCEGESCININTDCGTTDCSAGSISPPISSGQESELCTGNDCQKTQDETSQICDGDSCRRKESSDLGSQSECSSAECLDNKPISETNDKKLTVTKPAVGGISTEIVTEEAVTEVDEESHKPVDLDIKEPEKSTETSELLTTSSPASEISTLQEDLPSKTYDEKTPQKEKEPSEITTDIPEEEFTTSIEDKVTVYTSSPQYDVSTQIPYEDDSLLPTKVEDEKEVLESTKSPLIPAEPSKPEDLSTRSPAISSGEMEPIATTETDNLVEEPESTTLRQSDLPLDTDTKLSEPPVIDSQDEITNIPEETTDNELDDIFTVAPSLPEDADKQTEIHQETSTKTIFEEIVTEAQEIPSILSENEDLDKTKASEKPDNDDVSTPVPSVAEENEADLPVIQTSDEKIEPVTTPVSESDDSKYNPPGTDTSQDATTESLLSLSDVTITSHEATDLPVDFTTIISETDFTIDDNKDNSTTLSDESKLTEQEQITIEEGEEGSSHKPKLDESKTTTSKYEISEPLTNAPSISIDDKTIRTESPATSISDLSQIPESDKTTEPHTADVDELENASDSPDNLTTASPETSASSQDESVETESPIEQEVGKPSTLTPDTLSDNENKYNLTTIGGEFEKQTQAPISLVTVSVEEEPQTTNAETEDNSESKMPEEQNTVGTVAPEANEVVAPENIPEKPVTEHEEYENEIAKSTPRSELEQPMTSTSSPTDNEIVEKVTEPEHTLVSDTTSTLLPEYEISDNSVTEKEKSPESPFSETNEEPSTESIPAEPYIPEKTETVEPSKHAEDEIVVEIPDITTDIPATMIDDEIGSKIPVKDDQDIEHQTITPTDISTKSEEETVPEIPSKTPETEIKLPEMQETDSYETSSEALATEKDISGEAPKPTESTIMKDDNIVTDEPDKPIKEEISTITPEIHITDELVEPVKEEISTIIPVMYITDEPAVTMVQEEVEISEGHKPNTENVSEEKKPEITNIIEKEPDITNITEKEPDITNITEKEPEITNITETEPEVNNITEKEPEITNITEKEPDITNITEKEPEIANITEKEPEIINITEKEPEISDITEKTQYVPTVKDETHEEEKDRSTTKPEHDTEKPETQETVHPLEITSYDEVTTEQAEPIVTENLPSLTTQTPESHVKETEQEHIKLPETPATNKPQDKTTEEPQDIVTVILQEVPLVIPEQKPSDESQQEPSKTPHGKPEAPQDLQTQLLELVTTSIENDGIPTEKPLEKTTQPVQATTADTLYEITEEQQYDIATDLIQEVTTEEPSLKTTLISKEPENIMTEKPVFEDAEHKETSTDKSALITQSLEDIITTVDIHEEVTDLPQHTIDKDTDQDISTQAAQEIVTDKPQSTDYKAPDITIDDLTKMTTELLEPQEISTEAPQEVKTPSKGDVEIQHSEEPPVTTEAIQQITDSSEPEKMTPQGAEEENISNVPVVTEQSSVPKDESAETTPYLVELEEHTYKPADEMSTIIPTDEEQKTISSSSESPKEKTTEIYAEQTTDLPESEITDDKKSDFPTTFSPLPEKEEKPVSESVAITEKESEQPSYTDEPVTPKLSSETAGGSQFGDEESSPSTPKTEVLPVSEPEHLPAVNLPEQTEKTPTTEKQLEEEVSPETLVPPLEDEIIPITSKTTTPKAEEEMYTQGPSITDTKPQDKPSEILPAPATPESPKPVFNEVQPTDEIPDEESHFPPSGGSTGYGGQEPDYVEEDQAFGPGTCRYGGKVYVSAQQIPRDDPCDFCFCFRSDIICLQQSCPPPIHGCHEEPIQGFCCPRYECPVAMATTLNVTTTTTTTTTTLPPHFLPHAYKGAAQRRGCHIKGHSYKVGEVVRASSGPCLHCTCGGDGQMKCDPKPCTPEPMLRQMIAAAVSAKRRR